MYFYSLHYYKQAQQLKPNDSRMIIAVGEIYEKLDKIENALKCYFKACSVGDVEGLALIRLAKYVVFYFFKNHFDWICFFRLYDKLNDTENAAAAFTEYCLREDSNKDRAYEEQTDFYNALQYLANYHLNKGNLGDAYTYAYKCLDCDEVSDYNNFQMINFWFLCYKHNFFILFSLFRQKNKVKLCWKKLLSKDWNKNMNQK